MAKTLIGNVKGPQGNTGAKGDPGDKGDTGATGIRGSRWSEGTAITGTSTTATVFSGTGISDALVNDHYMNSSDGNVYRCVTPGTAANAQWIHVGNLRGATGPQGVQGIQGPRGIQGEKGEKGEKGDTPTLVSTYADLMANTVAGYVPDALAVKSGFNVVSTAIAFQSEEITNKSWLYSPSKNNALRVQDDGNVVLYDSDNKPLWDINSTKGKITGYATLFTGVHTIQFTDGVGHMSLLDFSENSYFGQLIGVVVNGFGTAHCFAASISDANVNTCDVIIKCITDPTLTAEQNVSVIYSFSWLGA